MAETLNDWSAVGVDEAEKRLVSETNTLFDDLFKNVENNPPFAELLRSILLEGKGIPFLADVPEINLGAMYGILKAGATGTQVSNIVFETRLYNYFAGIEEIRSAARARCARAVSSSAGAR